LNSKRNSIEIGSFRLINIVRYQFVLMEFIFQTNYDNWLIINGHFI